MLITLGAIFVLLLLSAFFSGSETALTAASKNLMHRLSQDGNKRADQVNKLRMKKERLIGAILLGNNLVNILASALATSMLIAMFGEAGVFYATLAMTLLVLIFAEILPKTYALKFANQASLAVAPILGVLVAILAPITAGINIIVQFTLHMMGIDVKSGEELGSAEEELRGAIELHEAEDDDTTHDERAMLRSVLDLGDVQVGEIMIHRKNVEAIDINQPASKVIAEVLNSPYTRIPLWEDDPDNIVGVLHAKALLRAIKQKQEQGEYELDDLNILDLAADPWFVPEQTNLDDQLRAFRDRREHFALVVDEYGSLMGVVTLEDIIEEIVGDITDEHDIAVSGVRSLPDGSYQVEGSVTIRDLNRQFNWQLPDEEAATLAGLVLHESRRIPEVGQAFKFHGFRFDILKRQRHQLTSIKITPPEEE